MSSKTIINEITRAFETGEKTAATDEAIRAFETQKAAWPEEFAEQIADRIALIG